MLAKTSEKRGSYVSSGYADNIPRHTTTRHLTHLGLNLRRSLARIPISTAQKYSQTARCSSHNLGDTPKTRPDHTGYHGTSI